MRVLIVLALVLPALAFPLPAQQRRLLEPHRMLPCDQDNSVTAVLGDVDGDGDPDVVVANSGQNRLYLNDGLGVFTDATGQLPAIAEGTLQVQLGDVDGDGDLDLWEVNSSRVRLLANDGAGVFTDASGRLPAGIALASALAIALGDVDGDGDLDALLGIDGQNILLLNDGTGTYTDATKRLPADTDYSTAVILLDVDADGDLDAVIGNLGAFFFGLVPARLYLNDGTGVFSDAPTQMPKGFENTRAMAAGDVDGDGDPDLLLANARNLIRGGSDDHVYLNDGTGVFSVGGALPPSGGDPASVALVDVDGDGDRDALVGNATTFTPINCLLGDGHLFVNDGAGNFVDASGQLPARSAHTAFAVGDVDGDGDPDALVLDQDLCPGNLDVPNRLYLNDGAGSFVDVTSLPAVLEAGRHHTLSVALGDVDGDGDVDAFLGTSTRNVLLLNDGLGRFAPAPVQPLSSVTTDVALGDVDGDGDLDAFLGTRAGQNRLHLNDGTGVFTNASGQIPAAVAATTSVVLVDVDADGDLDAVIGNGSAPNALLLNDGTGTFIDASRRLPGFLDLTEALATADVDGDGDADLLVGNTGQDRLLLNNAGFFTDATHRLPKDSEAATAIAVGDVDGDGDVDVFIANRVDNRLYLNDGTGSFADASTRLPPDRGALGVALADVDLDGDLDALLAGDDRLYLNDGAGTFTDATPSIPSAVSRSTTLAAGDLDGDGDADVWFGTGNLDRVYVSTGRHLVWGGWPRLGKRLELQVFGPPGEGWLLLLSTGTGSVPLSPFGVLRLDPSVLLPVGSGVLDGCGAAIAGFRVPGNRAFNGTTLAWQALIGQVPRFSNLELTTLTRL